MLTGVKRNSSAWLESFLVYLNGITSRPIIYFGEFGFDEKRIYDHLYAMNKKRIHYFSENRLWQCIVMTG